MSVKYRIGCEIRNAIAPVGHKSVLPGSGLQRNSLTFSHYTVAEG
ncbi:hypothetical protein [Moorena producens]